MRVHITVTDDNGNSYEGTADLTGASRRSAKIKTGQKPSKPAKVVGPASAIKKLYNEHFFKTGKSVSEVMKKLSDKGINFTIYLISMALFRAKYLTKKGTRGRYTFVQKHPPS